MRLSDGGPTGSQTQTRTLQVFSANRYHYRPILKFLAPRRGFKPRTLALTVRCSIAELTRNLEVKQRLV